MFKFLFTAILLIIVVIAISHIYKLAAAAINGDRQGMASALSEAGESTKRVLPAVKTVLFLGVSLGSFVATLLFWGYVTLIGNPFCH